MVGQIYKLCLVSLLLVSYNYAYSFEKVSFKLNKDSFNVNDSVVITIENKYKDTLFVFETILFHNKSNNIYQPYLQGWELYVNPVSGTDKFKGAPHKIVIPPFSKKEVSFYINQPYIRDKTSKYPLYTQDSEIALGNFLLEFRVSLKSPKNKNPLLNYTSIVMFKRYSNSIVYKNKIPKVSNKIINQIDFTPCK